MASLLSMTTSSETGAALAAEAEAVAAAINTTAQQSGGSARQARKRSLPSLMIRRALGSLENLSGDNGCASASSSCTSQLDHVRPPADMESSMLSVASITSEVAEVEEDLPDGGGSCSTGGEDLTESGSGGGTGSPIALSSATKTSAPTRMAARQTARQRRQAARDRYRTYTVDTAAAAAAELHATMAVETVEEGVEVTTPVAEQPPPSEISPPPDSETVVRTGTYRITPKQRRQEDRQRFQTQVLDKPSVTSPASPPIPGQDGTMNVPVTEISTTVMATTVTRKHRRSSESRERFRTRTLDGDQSALDLRATEDIESQMPPPASDELLLNSLLEREANILAEDIEALRTGDSLLLECETLSLVSIDSETTSESGHGIEGYNGDENAEPPQQQQPTHHAPDEEAEEGDAEDKTLRAGACDTPDPDDVLGLVDAPEVEVGTEEASADRHTRQVTSEEVATRVPFAEPAEEQTAYSPAEVKEPDCVVLSENSDDQSMSSTDDEGCTQKRPRIIKPVARSRDGSADAAGSGDGSPKPVRGRRKPLRSGIPVTAVAPLKAPVVSANKVQQQKQQQQQQQQQPPQEPEPQQIDPQFRPPERQGTFTKDEPTAVVAVNTTVTAAPPPDASRKKKRPATASRVVTPGSNAGVGAAPASAPASAKRATARREATSKIAGLWKKAEDSKTKQKQQQQHLQKKELRIWNSGGAGVTHTTPSAAAQKMSSATARGRGTTRTPVSRIPTADSVPGATRAEKAARKDLASASSRPERGGQTVGRGSSVAVGYSGRPRRIREDSSVTGSAQHASSVPAGAGRPFGRSTNPRPASAIVQPFNYSPPASQAQQPVVVVRSQIPTLVKREEPPLQLNTASIRITTV